MSAKKPIAHSLITKHVSPEVRSAPDNKERARRWVVSLVFIIYWLLIFEGALRKWAFPSLQKILFFIRDPFVLTCYILAFKHKLWPKWNLLFATGVIFACAFLLLALIQSLVLGVNPIVVAYGWRNYFYYLPLAFLIGEQFRGRDLARLVRQTLMVTIPIAVLCFKQFSSPAEDVINQSYGHGAAMLVARGVVRTSGTFTIASAQALFIGSVFAMLLCVWLLPKTQRPLGRVWLWLSTGAAITTLAVSGARGSFGVIAPVVVAAGVSVVLLHKGKINWRRMLILPTLVLVAAVAYVTVFHYAFEVMSERVSTARGVEGSILVRIIGPFLALPNLWPQLSVLGAGIGVGTNAGVMLRTGSMGFLAEDEWGRIVLEAGIFGLLYIAYRCWLTGWLVVQAFKATKRSRNSLPLCLVAFEAIILAAGQMTLQGTINGYGFLFAGFCMAANRLGTRFSKIASAERKQDPWV